MRTRERVGSAVGDILCCRYFGPLVPLAGGHGAPEGVVPGVEEPGVEEFPWLPLEVEGAVPGFVAEPFGEPVVPGRFPHGALLGFVLPGVVFGFTVDGLVLFPGVGEFGELAFGTVEGVVEPGVCVVPGVVVVPGVCVVPGVWVCPAVPELPAGDVPPAGALCATSQLAHSRITDKKVSFVALILRCLLHCICGLLQRFGKNPIRYRLCGRS